MSFQFSSRCSRARCGVVSYAMTKLQPPPLMPLPGIEFMVVSQACDTAPSEFTAQLLPKIPPRLATEAVSPVIGMMVAIMWIPAIACTVCCIQNDDSTPKLASRTTRLVPPPVPTPAQPHELRLSPRLAPPLL